MYAFTAILIIVLSAFLNGAAFFVYKRKSAFFLALAESLLFAAGLSGAVITVICFKFFVSSPSYSTDFRSWASDSFFLYFEYSVIFCLIAAILSLLSAFVKSKMIRLRNIFCTVSEILILFSAYIYSCTAASETFNVKKYILILAVFESLFLRMCPAADGIALYREIKSDEKIKKKEKDESKKQRRKKSAGEKHKKRKK